MGPWFHEDRTIPPEGWIWVFGSNTDGRHGKGAALVAKQTFGAEYGVGVGRTGDAYAIPTKAQGEDRTLTTLAIDVVEGHIRDFIDYARAYPDLKFFVTRVGCELAGYADHQIASLFSDASPNCSFAEEWHRFMTQPRRATASRPR